MKFYLIRIFRKEVDIFQQFNILFTHRLGKLRENTFGESISVSLKYTPMLVGSFSLKKISLSQAVVLDHQTIVQH